MSNSNSFMYARLLPALLVAALGWTVTSPAAAQSPESGDTMSTLDRVYSEEQAREGRQVFDVECALCHAPSEFSGRLFQLSWTGRPVGALFSQIRGTMPLDRPGALTPAQYAAVVAYLLELNGYPAGDTALPANAEALSRILVEPAPEDGR